MESPARPLHSTTSLCSSCRRGLPAVVVALADGRVELRKECPEHGAQRVILGQDAGWYEAARAHLRPVPPSATAGRPVAHGCPFDCGPCTQHAQRPTMPIVTVTSRCDLRCPMCFVHNSPAGAGWSMPTDEFRRVLDTVHRVAAGPDGRVDVLNLTGGEVTLHPQLLELLAMARDAGVHRVSVCSHGLSLARDEATVQRLAELRVRVALSFDTFDDATDQQLNGVRSVRRKLEALAALERHGVDVTLIPVLARGRNDHEIGRILDLAMASPSVRHVEVHTLTFTGQGGRTFDRSARMSMHDALLAVEAHTPWLRRDDFVPHPGAHPLCYHVAYVLLDPAGGPPLSLAALVGRPALSEALTERLYLEPTPALEDALRDAVDRAFTDDGPEAARATRALRNLLDALAAADPAEPLRSVERWVKAIYLHSHMDEETFDTERAARCCDVNVKPDGRTVPVCNDNVLYRESERAFVDPPRPVPTLGGDPAVFGR